MCKCVHVFVHGACLHACVCVRACILVHVHEYVHPCGGWVTTFEHVCVCTCIHTCKHTHAHNTFACTWGVSDNACACVNECMCESMHHCIVYMHAFCHSPHTCKHIWQIGVHAGMYVYKCAFYFLHVRSMSCVHVYICLYLMVGKPQIPIPVSLLPPSSQWFDEVRFCRTTPNSIV